MDEFKLEYQDCITYNILGTNVYLYSDEYDFGINTVAEVDGRFHYLGSEQPSLLAAVFALQEVYNIQLTDRELKQVLEENTNNNEEK